MSYSCRYRHLVAVLAAIDQEEIGDLPVCDKPARFATSVKRERNGRDEETFTRTCEQHDQQFQGDPGYTRSTELSRTTP